MSPATTKYQQRKAARERGEPMASRPPRVVCLPPNIREHTGMWLGPLPTKALPDQRLKDGPRMREDEE